MVVHSVQSKSLDVLFKAIVLQSAETAFDGQATEFASPGIYKYVNPDIAYVIPS